MVGYSRDAGATSVRVEEEHQQTLELMQLEALAPLRIEKVKTSEYKEKRREYVPSAYIQRRIDEDGTEENRAAQGEGGQKLATWNTAWTALQDDGTTTEELRDVNEGLGQTHRGKLQADDSARYYIGEGFSSRGGHRGGRGGYHGGRVIVGRGGGFAGRSQGEGRRAATECLAPVKRTRVVKGSGPSHVSSIQPAMKPGIVSEIRPAAPASPRRSTSTRKQVSGGRLVGPTIRLWEVAPKSGEVSDSRPSKKAVNFEGNLATPDDFMARVNRKNGPAAGTPDTSKSQVEATAGPEAVATPYASNVVNPQVRTPGPEAIAIAYGSNVTRPQVEDPHPRLVATPYVLQTPKQPPEDVSVKAVVAGPDSTAPAHLPSAQIDLLDTDIGGDGPCHSVVNFTHLADSKAGTASLKPSASFPSSGQQVPTPENSSFLKNIETLQALGSLSTKQLELLQTLKLQAQVRASEQAREASSSWEDGNTTIDEPVSQPIKVDTAPSVPQAVVTPLAKADPQESLAKRLVAQRTTIIGQHVHRTRFQHSALLEKFQKVLISEKTPSKMAEVKADGLSTCNPFGPAKLAASQQSAAGPLLPLPVHLAHQAPVTDLRAAVCAQYGPSSDRGATNVHTGPFLPAHLTSIPPVTDASAATHAPDDATASTSRSRGILNPVSNGQLRSFPSRDPAPSAPSPAPPPRRSMLNSTGFIGLAENRAKAEKSDNPQLVARKRGM